MKLTILDRGDDDAPQEDTHRKVHQMFMAGFTALAGLALAHYPGLPNAASALGLAIAVVCAADAALTARQLVQTGSHTHGADR